MRQQQQQRPESGRPLVGGQRGKSKEAENTDTAELSYIDCGVSRLLDLPLHHGLTVLNCHCNRIENLAGLERAPNLHHLDLSSNRIGRISGLDSLGSLRTLNLAGNRLVRVEGLAGLHSLVRLNLSYNAIRDVVGFSDMRGPAYRLTCVELHGNQIRTVSQLTKSLRQCRNLRHLTLSLASADNTACRLRDYRRQVLTGLPQLDSLDQLDRQGNRAAVEVLADVPGLEEFLEFLGSSSAATENEGEATARRGLPTPKIDAAYKRFRVRRPADDDDNNEVEDKSEDAEVDDKTEGEGEKAYRERLEQLERRLDQLTAAAGPAPTDAESNNKRKEDRLAAVRDPHNALANNSERGQKSHATRKDNKGDSSSAAGPAAAATASCANLTVAGQAAGPKKADGLTYGELLRELDQERERRWKSEAACRRLAEHAQLLQAQSREDAAVRSAAVDAAEKLKSTAADEREMREAAEARAVKAESAGAASEAARVEAERRAEELRAELDRLRRSTGGEERRRAQAAAGAEARAARAEAEAATLRSQAERQAESLRQAEHLLAEREREFQRQLAGCYRLGSPELESLVAKETERERRCAAQAIRRLDERLAEAGERYRALEDEFRLALRLQAQSEDRLQRQATEATDEAAGLRELYQAAKSRDADRERLVAELSQLAKEQKAKLENVAKLRLEEGRAQKAREQKQEEQLEEARRRLADMDSLRKENKRLTAQLAAQDSLIEGLRAEKRLWADELAQQGSALAQDRGRLESRVELLQSEVASLKRQLEHETDSLKIKTKVAEDLLDTVRKMKDSLAEKDAAVRRVQEESIERVRVLEEQLQLETESRRDAEEQAKALSERKEELKQEVEELTERCQRAERSAAQLTARWRDKSEQIDRMESQVEQLRAEFERREAELRAERDKAAAAAAAATEQLRNADDAFRAQLDAQQTGHRRQTEQLERQLAKARSDAETRVADVEEEMRQLLRDTEGQKQRLEAKVRQLTAAFNQVAQDLAESALR